MKTKFLFPNKFIKIGLILFSISILLTSYTNIFGDINILTKVPVLYFYDSGVFQKINIHSFMGFKHDDIQFELFVTLFVLGCVFAGFSKLKSEDEYTINLRLESLLWAMYVNFAVFLFSVLFVYGIVFVEIPFYSLLAFLVIYNMRFYYILYKSKKSISYEK